MSSNRKRLWSTEVSAAYWKESDAAARRATAARYGEHTARELDTLWRSLADDERELLELLLLSGKRSIVAPYDDVLCNALVSRRLLQIPAGVGTLLMQDLETTFKIPRAVWRELIARKECFVPCSEPEAGERLAHLSRLMKRRLQDPAHD